MTRKPSKKSAKSPKVTRHARPKPPRARSKTRLNTKGVAPSRRAARKKVAKRPAKKVASAKRSGSSAKKKTMRKPRAGREAQLVTPTRPKPRAAASSAKARRRRRDDADAFLRVRKNGRRTKDDFARELGEDFVGSATSGEDQGLATRDTVLDEESGGPFVTTPARREFAKGYDASNPEDAEREPFPSAQSQPDS